MGDKNLQIDLNAAILAVKNKCVDLDERVLREDAKPQNQARGYLNVRRYIYARTSRTNEHASHKRGRSVTRVYMEQKFYRSKSVPTPEQVERLEDVVQDYGPHGEERLEFTETMNAPISELIKDDRSHSQVLFERLPRGHPDWDHEHAVYEEDGVSGRLEDRKLILKAGDDPEGLNHLNEVSEEISTRISEFLNIEKGVEREEKERSYEFSSRSKSIGNLYEQNEVSVAKSITSSLGDLYQVQSQNTYDSKYGRYTSGYGIYGFGQDTSTHVYAEPVVTKKDLVDVEIYQRKYDFKTRFPPSVDLPEGYHPYYSPSRYAFNDTEGYFRGNCTRPLHYSYSTRDTFEKYSDYLSSGRESRNVETVEGNVEENRVLSESIDTSHNQEYYDAYAAEPEVIPEPEIVLERSQDIDFHQIEPREYVEYYDAYAVYEEIPEPEIVLERSQDVSHHEIESREYVEYYDASAVYDEIPEPEIVLERSQDIDHHEIESREYVEYYDAYAVQEVIPEPEIVLERSHDIEHVHIDSREYAGYYDAYEVQEVTTVLEEEPVYEEVYERVYDDVEQTISVPEVPQTPLPPPPVPASPPPPPSPPATPIPAERHYDEIYVGQEALAISLSPTFGVSTDQKNLGLEKSVHDRVRELEKSMSGDEEARRILEEKEERRRQLEEEIRISRLKMIEEVELEEKRKYIPAPLAPIVVPSIFETKTTEVVEVVPEKPKRTWVPPPKVEHHEIGKEDKPLGPVIFHELIYQQGILRQMYDEEHHHHNSRPVNRPVSRAQSRPTTPGPEHRSIDFPRVEGVQTDGLDEIEGHVNHIVHQYNAYEAEDSQTIEKKNTGTRRKLNVYEDVNPVYDVPADADVTRPNDLKQTSEWDKEIHQTNVRHSHDENHVARSTTRTVTTTSQHYSTSTVLNSSTLNRENIPSPLNIKNSAVSMSNLSHDESSENSIRKAHSQQEVSLNVGHVKNLAKRFNSPDAKPITVEQVVYRVRNVPPGHVLETNLKARPRSLRRIPLDEVELHEHGVHQKHHTEEINGNNLKSSFENEQHVYTLTSEQEPTIRVRQVYNVVVDGENATSVLSPVSLPTHEPLYATPTDAI